MPEVSARVESLAVPIVSLPPLPESSTRPRPAEIWSLPSGPALLIAASPRLPGAVMPPGWAMPFRETGSPGRVASTLCVLTTRLPSPVTVSLPLPTVMTSFPGPPATRAAAEFSGRARSVRSSVVMVSSPLPPSTHELPSPVRMLSAPSPPSTMASLSNGMASPSSVGGAPPEKVMLRRPAYPRPSTTTVLTGSLDVSAKDSVMPRPRTSTAAGTSLPSSSVYAGTCRITQVSSLPSAAQTGWPR